jgi:hypothetical protein
MPQVVRTLVTSQVETYPLPRTLPRHPAMARGSRAWIGNSKSSVSITNV